MPELTRRSENHRQECWHIYYGDIHAGTIAERTGNPHDTDPWEWCCGFYPGSHPGEHDSGTAAAFDEARVDFERAWHGFLSKRTDYGLKSDIAPCPKSAANNRLTRKGVHKVIGLLFWRHRTQIGDDRVEVGS